MSNEYGETKSVIDAIHELHVALEMRYMRSRVEIRLEPDAFYRLQNEVKGKSQTQPISQDDFNRDEMVMNTQSGELTIVKDTTLGVNSYTPVWVSEGK